jgi:hypothetical protein
MLVLLEVLAEGVCISDRSERPEKIKQTIDAKKSVVPVFAIPRGFDAIDVLPQQPTFNTTHFISNLLLRLAAKFSNLAGDIGRRSLLIHCDNSQCSNAKVSSVL